MANCFRLIGFRVVEPSSFDKLIQIINDDKNKNFKGIVSKRNNDELWNKIADEIKLSQRKFAQNQWYFFYDGYFTDSKGVIIKDVVSKSYTLYSNEQITIDVNCIVGKNGSGKSSIIELIIKILNNFVFAIYGDTFNIDESITYLKYCENIYADLAIEDNDSIMILSIRGRIISIIKNDNTVVEFQVNNELVYGKDGYNYFSNYINDFSKRDNIKKIASYFGNIFTLIVGYKFNNLYSMSFENESQKNKNTNLPHLYSVNRNKILFSDYAVSTHIETALTNISYNAGIFALTELPKDNFDIPIRFVQSDANHYSAKTDLDFIRSKDYTNQLKINNRELFYNHLILQLCFYGESIGYPLRNINNDCKIIGIVKRMESPIFPSYSLLVSDQDLQESLLQKIKREFGINMNSDNRDAERLESIIKTLVINKLFENFKATNRNTIVQEWVNDENNDEYKQFEKKHIKTIIEARGNSYLGKDYASYWSDFKKKHTKDWLNTQLVDFLFPTISNESIIRSNSKEFNRFAIDNYRSVIRENDLIFRYIKMLQLISSGVDLFFKKKKVNEPIYLEELYIGGEDINDVIYALKYLKNFDLILYDNVMGDRVLDGLSSGERHLLNFRSILLYHLLQVDKLGKCKYVNIMFDEIEMYLHPEWQRQFLSKIIDGIKLVEFESIKNINFLIATHSPFILSDVPKSNILFLDDNGSVKNRDSIGQTFCANIHDLFNNGFFMESTLGEVAISNINRIVKLYKFAQNEGNGSNNRANEYIKKELLDNKLQYIYICSILGDNYYRKTVSYMLKYLFLKYNIPDTEILSEDELNEIIKEKKKELEDLENLKKMRKK